MSKEQPKVLQGLPNFCGEGGTQLLESFVQAGVQLGLLGEEETTSKLQGLRKAMEQQERALHAGMQLDHALVDSPRQQDYVAGASAQSEVCMSPEDLEEHLRK